GDPPLEPVEDLLDQHRCEAQRGLVEENELRPRHYRAAEREHLLLPAGERARLLALALLEPREVLEHVLGVLFHAATSRVGAEAEVLPDGKLVERPPPFGHVRDAGACGSVGPARKLRAVEEDVPGPAHGARDGTQRRRLAGAVRAEDGDELALADLQ